jgi:stearoyl-CoA desaturase (delta-9 desaturase)
VVHDATTPTGDPARARHIVVTPNGDVFVAIDSEGGGVLALRDTDGDGKPDETTTFGSDPGHGIAFRERPSGWTLGAAGTVWAVQLFHMPLQGGIVNGIGHGWGYRNFDTKDHSTNLFPFGLWIAGEELHNNHHADPKAACFRKRWFEVDTGWVYVRVLENLGLATSVHRGTVVSSG